MDHVAIMKKSWNLTDKIISGGKKIESRWYKTKHTPWDKIKTDDTIYFKNSGEPVRIEAEVEKVLQFSDLTPKMVMELLWKYWELDGLEEKDVPKFHELFREKKYCILVFLKNAREVVPFEIDKRGFGSMSAWISVDDIDKIKIAERNFKRG